MEDQHRFRELFVATYPSIRRYAHHLGLGAADAEDLAADVFTVAWTRLHAVPLDDPLPWLLAVARNHWRNQLRRRTKSSALTERLRGTTTAVAPPPPDASGDGPGVRAAFSRLSAKDREILVLVAWDGLSPQQAATVLGCSSAAARVRLHRARSRLGTLLGRGETRTGTSTVPGTGPE